MTPKGPGAAVLLGLALAVACTGSRTSGRSGRTDDAAAPGKRRQQLQPVGVQEPSQRHGWTGSVTDALVRRSKGSACAPS